MATLAYFRAELEKSHVDHLVQIGILSWNEDLVKGYITEYDEANTRLNEVDQNSDEYQDIQQKLTRLDEFIRAINLGNVRTRRMINMIENRIEYLRRRINECFVYNVT